MATLYYTVKPEVISVVNSGIVTNTSIPKAVMEKADTTEPEKEMEAASGTIADVPIERKVEMVMASATVPVTAKEAKVVVAAAEILVNAKGAETVVTSGEGVVHIKLDEELPLSDFVKKTGKAAFVNAKKAGKVKAEKKKKKKKKLPGLQRMDDAAGWTLESYSTRKAILQITAVSMGVPALRVILAGGRGDTIYIGHNFAMSESATSLKIRLLTNCSEEDSISLGIVLTTDKERPWLEIDPVQLEKGSWKEMEFDLAALKAGKAAKKITKVNKIILTVKSDSEEGFLLIENMDLW